jgi:DNA-binding response OmpR family regulator
MNEKKKVLIVEDEFALMMILEKIFVSSGFLVEKAGDGLEAINALNANPPDIMILDLMLPKLSGFKILEIIKEDIDFKKIPIIVLSARVGDINRNLALNAGADEFMEKPFSPFEVLTRAKRLLF